MEVYRSGHNEAVLKTVWVQAHGGSNPSASATERTPDRVFFSWRRKSLVERLRFCESKNYDRSGEALRSVSGAVSLTFRHKPKHTRGR